MNVDATPETAQPPAAPLAPSRPAKPCADCGAPMLGPFCYACGQPEKGMIRHLASVMADVADTIFNVDSRIFRSIPALYFRPGFLTNEYFAGRRTRYVTPFRLFFFLCVIAFFAIQFASMAELDSIEDGVSMNGITSAQTPEELDERTNQFVSELQSAQKAVAISPKAVAKIGRNIDEARKKSQQRRAYLIERAKAIAGGKPTPPDESSEHNFFEADGVSWKPTHESTRVAWLPDFANEEIFETSRRFMENLASLRSHPARIVAGVFSVLPQTLFVLMPLFALLLKIAYIFKRRLYMEHLMVALHSHAFIFLSLLLIVIVHQLAGWTAVHAAPIVPVLYVLLAALWTWLIVYLFLMAKNVYRQGWFMTTVKFCFVGLCYTILFTFGLIGAGIAALATT